MQKARALVFMVTMLIITESPAFGGLSGWGGVGKVQQVAVAIDSTMKACFSISAADCNRRLDRIAEGEDAPDHTVLLQEMVSMARSNIVERDPYTAKNYYRVVRGYATYRFGPESREVEYVRDKLATVEISRTVERDTPTIYSPEEVYSPEETYSGIGDDGSLVFSDDPTKVPKSAKKGHAKSNPPHGRTKASKAKSEILGTWCKYQTENDGRTRYSEISFDEDGQQTYFVEESLPGGSKRRSVTTARYVFREGMLSLTSKQPPQNYAVKVTGDSLAITSTSGPFTIVYQRKK